MPTLRYVDAESVSQGGGEPKDQVPRQRRPVDINHEAGTTVAAAAASRNAATEANQIPHKRRPVDASHGAGSAVGAAAPPSARGAAAGPAATSTAPKSREQSLGGKGGTNNTAPAPNPTPPSSSNISPAKSGRSSLPVAPTKKIRRSCSMPNCIKPSQGPRYNHMCKIHMAADSTGASSGSASASASHFKGTGDRTHRPPRPRRQQKMASAFTGVDRDVDQKTPPSLPPPLQSSSKAAIGKNPISFLFKLHDMLDDASSGDPDRNCQIPGAPNKKLNNVVSFSRSGKAFLIRSEIDFRSYVLPLYFGKASYLTFKRVINHYGFVRLTKGPDKGCYFHAFFRQNHKHLVHLIKPGKPTTDCSSDSASSPSAQATAPSQSALEGQGKIPFRRVGDLSLPEASVGIEDANGKGKKSSVQFTDQDDDDVEDYCEV